eukprot:1157240-Pelagomonas_calceolata.AAC.5
MSTESLEQQAKKNQVGPCREGSRNERDEHLKRIGEIAYRIDELMRTLGMGDALMSEEYKQLLDGQLVLSRELRGVYKHAENAQM